MILGKAEAGAGAEIQRFRAADRPSGKDRREATPQ